jgi:hypothetical protein
MFIAKLAISLVLTAAVANATPSPAFTCSRLTPEQVATSCTSNNPLKKWLFSYSYQPYELTVVNPTAHTLILHSATSTPQPLDPTRTENKLSQSKSFLPWLIGAGWSTTLITVFGLAIVPSVAIGVTVIIAGTIGMRNKPLPASTAHTIRHLLFDGKHDYQVEPYSCLTCIVILPAQTTCFTLRYHDDQSSTPQQYSFPLMTKGSTK